MRNVRQMIVFIPSYRKVQKEYEGETMCLIRLQEHKKAISKGQVVESVLTEFILFFLKDEVPNTG